MKTGTVLVVVIGAVAVVYVLSQKKKSTTSSNPFGAFLSGLASNPSGAVNSITGFGNSISNLFRGGSSGSGSGGVSSTDSSSTGAIPFNGLSLADGIGSP